MNWLILYCILDCNVRKWWKCPITESKVVSLLFLQLTVQNIYRDIKHQIVKEVNPQMCEAENSKSSLTVQENCFKYIFV